MSKKEFLVLPINNWLLIIIAPCLVNILAWIPNPLVKGDYSVWIGFLGNYCGGIIGVIVAFTIAKTQSDLTRKQLMLQINQLESDREEKETKKKDNDIKIRKIVRFYLFDEIQRNLSKVHELDLKSIKDRVMNVSISGHTHICSYSDFDFKEFDILKYDLLKFDIDMSYDVVQFYRSLRKFESLSGKNVIDFKIDDCFLIVNSFNAIYNRFDEI